MPGRFPPEAVEAVLPAAEKAVGAAVAQDSAALWISPAEKADIKKRLVMLKQRQSTTAVRQASGRRRGSHVEMPSAIKGKKVSPTLRDGALLCALWQSGACAQSQEDCGRTPVCHSLSHGPGVWREPHSRRVQREALGECRGGGNSADAAEQAAVAGFNLLSKAFVVILQSGNRSCRTLHTLPGAFAALTWDIIKLCQH